MSWAAAAIAAAVVCGGAGARVSREADDALARYLESRGLDALLIDQLEAMLARATPDDRATLAERLATLYAGVLEKAGSAEARAAIERRARALLDTFPEAEGFDLRLNLHRANYARVEAIAERARVGLASPEETADAARALRGLLTDLSQIGAAAHRRVEALERQERGPGAEIESALLRDSLASARRQRSMAMYLAGWSGVYLAETAERMARTDARPGDVPTSGALAVDAARKFGWLLNAPANEAPTLDRVPGASLRLDHVARAAVGVGICASLRNDHEDATRWFDLVDQAGETPGAVREQLFARRLAAAARNQEWTEALRLVRARRGSESPAPAPGVAVTALTPAEARLLAVLSFEGEAPARTSAVMVRLREIALADLIEAQELTQALDLTNRYGAEALAGLGDASGFIPTYIRALQSYARAREGHERAVEASAGKGDSGTDEPASDRAVVGLYEEAAGLLKAAVGAADADRFGPARANAAMLLGMATFLSSGDGAGAAAAAERFGAAATLATTPALVADALWMRLRALERAETFARATATSRKASAGSRDARALAEATAKREGAAQEFLARFPSDARATGALLQRAADSKGAGDDATLAGLLAVEPGSPMRAAARREASRLLFLRVRGAEGTARRAAVDRFAEVAEPALEEACALALRGDAEAGAHAKRLARQLLDAYLSGPAADAMRERAAGAMERLLALEANAGVSLADCREEARFRRLQIAASRGESALVYSIGAEVGTGDGSPDDAFAAASRRLVTNFALSAWREGERDVKTARALMAHGAATLGALARDESPAADPDDAMFGLLLGVADAAHAAWAAERSEADRSLALRLLRSAVRLRPMNGAALRAAAERADALGDTALGMESWRRLMVSAELGSDRWFEATTERLTLLMRTDAASARELLAKHRAIYPEYGPEPWGARLRALEGAAEQPAGGGS